MNQNQQSDVEFLELLCENWLQHCHGTKIKLLSLTNGFIFLQTLALLPNIGSKLDLSYYTSDLYFQLDVDASENWIWNDIFNFCLKFKLLIPRTDVLTEEQLPNTEERTKFLVNQIRQGNKLALIEALSLILQHDEEFCNEYPEAYSFSSVSLLSMESTKTPLVSPNKNSIQNSSLTLPCQPAVGVCLDKSMIIKEANRLQSTHVRSTDFDLEGALAHWLNAVLESSGNGTSLINEKESLFYEVQRILPLMFESLARIYLPNQTLGTSIDAVALLGENISKLDPSSAYNLWIQSTDSIEYLLSTESRSNLLSFFCFLFESCTQLQNIELIPKTSKPSQGGASSENNKSKAALILPVVAAPESQDHVKKHKVRVSLKQLREISSLQDDVLIKPSFYSNLQSEVSPSLEHELENRQTVFERPLISSSPQAKAFDMVVKLDPSLEYQTEEGSEQSIEDQFENEFHQTADSENFEQEEQEHELQLRNEFRSFQLCNLESINVNEEHAETPLNFEAAASETINSAPLNFEVHGSETINSDLESTTINDDIKFPDIDSSAQRDKVASNQESPLFAAQNLPRVRTPWVENYLQSFIEKVNEPDSDSDSEEFRVEPVYRSKNANKRFSETAVLSSLLDKLLSDDDISEDSSLRDNNEFDFKEDDSQSFVYSSGNSENNDADYQNYVNRNSDTIVGQTAYSGQENNDDVLHIALGRPEEQTKSENSISTDSTAKFAADNAVPNVAETLIEKSTAADDVPEVYLRQREQVLHRNESVYSLKQLEYGEDINDEAEPQLLQNDDFEVNDNVISYTLSKAIQNGDNQRKFLATTNAVKIDSAIEIQPEFINSEADINISNVHEPVSMFVNVSNDDSSADWNTEKEKVEAKKQEFLKRIEIRRKQSIEQCPAEKSESTSKLTKFKTVLKTASKSKNIKIIKNALLSMIREGVNDSLRKEVLECLAHCPVENQYVILLRDSKNLTFKGLYSVEESFTNDDDEQINTKYVLEKMYYGKATVNAPSAIPVEKVQEFFKYDTGSKTFKLLPAKTISSAVHAVAISTNFLKTNRVVK